ncbi:hypothetical protein CHS0354_006954 [Potamilus streckersoni]|uniref:VWFA domain-containing protein n=1 Tax=Potamilus streckersoni TaxID=2493646 RepID=A0AAE0TFE8_9BIVA|nr:hypothetical protein CHS0354_006954 [Potamilus streckersoni]
MKLRVMYVQPSLKKISAWLLLVLLLGTACLYAQDKASKPKDIILVVDISRSMIGYGNKGEQTANIFPDVIKSLELFVNELKPGDTLSLIRFGKTVYPVKKYTVTGEGDLEKIKAAVLAVGAKDHSTYTAKMLRALKSYLEKIDTKDKSKERIQLAVIFTDALDDPPAGKRKSQYRCPTLTVKTHWEKLSQNVIDNLRPLIEVSVKTTPYKPLQPNVFPIEITANKEADGLQAEVTLQQGEENYLSLSTTTLTLKEGLNTIQLNSDIPVRFEGDWAAKLNFKINTELESIVKPSNPTEFSVTALPLTLTEKTLHRAEFLYSGPDHIVVTACRADYCAVSFHQIYHIYTGSRTSPLGNH